MIPGTEFVDAVSLPRRIIGQGYVYAITYSNGTVKVGSTVNPHIRMGQHRKHAAPFEIDITWCWVSPPHSNYLASEYELVRIADELAERRLLAEYFIGLNVADLIARFAAWEQAPRLPDPSPTLARTECNWAANRVATGGSPSEAQMLDDLEHLLDCSGCPRIDSAEAAA